MNKLLLCKWDHVSPLCIGNVWKILCPLSDLPFSRRGHYNHWLYPEGHCIPVLHIVSANQKIISDSSPIINMYMYLSYHHHLQCLMGNTAMCKILSLRENCVFSNTGSFKKNLKPKLQLSLPLKVINTTYINL